MKMQIMKKKESQGITKQESAMLQGIAVLLMIYHHFFNDLSIHGESLRFWNAEVVIRFAWFGKICVGIFAFVSGYGMFKVLEHKSGGAMVKRCVSQTLGLLIRYWIVLLVFMGAFFSMGKRSFEPREFLQNFFCVSDSYNGAFWYVQEYVFFMLLLILVHGFFAAFSKKGEATRGKGILKIFYGILVVAGLLWLGLSAAIPSVRESLKLCLDTIRIAFVLVFFMGYFSSRFHTFESLFDKLYILSFSAKDHGAKSYNAQSYSAQNHSFINYFLQRLLGFLLCGAVMTLRMLLADAPSYARLDFLFVPVFALGLIMLFYKRTDDGKSVPGLLGALFEHLGHLSVYLWLTHLFVFDITKDLIYKITNSHFIFFLLEAAICIFVGYTCYLAEYYAKNLASSICKITKTTKNGEMSK